MALYTPLLALGLAALTTAAPTSTAASPAETGPSYTSGFDMTTSWSMLTPYQDSPGFGLPKGVPRGCELTNVHILHRHAQRYPGPYDTDGLGMEDFSKKLETYRSTHDNNTVVGTGPLSFLAEWRYLLGLDVLLPTGAATEATSGAHMWSEYGRMLYRAPKGVSQWDEKLNVYPNGTARAKPVFRTTDMERILESARWWASGFFGDIDADPSHDQYDLVITPEGKGFNNTLAADHSCDGDIMEGIRARETFIEHFTTTAQTRLSPFLPPDFNLTALDVNAMLNLCPYETATLGNSSFCALFTEQEWLDFAYSIDLQYHGSFGFGSPAGRAQGIGYVEELAARISGDLITTSDTSVNTTISGNAATFPLDQPLYLDMSHDDVIVSVLAALGLEYFNYGEEYGLPADIDHEVSNRTFRLNHITPFGAHLVSEQWRCPANTSFTDLDEAQYENPDLSGHEDTTSYIRFVLNGAPVPLSGAGGCDGVEDGFCPVEDFVNGVGELKVKAAYQEVCFGRYNPGHQVADGGRE